MNKYIILLKIVRIVRFFYGLQFWPEIPVVSTNTDSFNKTVILWLLVLCEEVFFQDIFNLGMHVFWTRAPFFWTCTCFLDLTGFFRPRVTKNMGDLLVCLPDPVGIFFWTCMYLCWTQGNFFDSQINCFWARFLFFGPVRLLRGPCLHRVGGELHCYRRSHWAGCFWTLAPSFLEPVHVSLDLAQAGGNLDTETRCMQEVFDAGEVPVLKQ